MNNFRGVERLCLLGAGGSMIWFFAFAWDKWKQSSDPLLYRAAADYWMNLLYICVAMVSMRKFCVRYRFVSLMNSTAIDYPVCCMTGWQWYQCLVILCSWLIISLTNITCNRLSNLFLAMVLITDALILLFYVHQKWKWFHDWTGLQRMPDSTTWTTLTLKRKRRGESQYTWASSVQ